MHKNRRNYYRILHVQSDAPAEIIKTSHRTLMQKLRYHPDLGGDDRNAALLNEALAVLTDATKRALYDAECKLDSAGPRQRAADTREQAQTDFAARDTGSWSASNKQGTCAPPGIPSGALGAWTPESARGRRTDYHQTGFLASCQFCGTRSNGMSSCTRCHSPLLPPPPPGEGSPDQRAFERLAIEADVQIFVKWPQDHGYPAVVRDLTPGGMQIVLQASLEPNQIIKISSEFIDSVSRVVICNANEQGHGFNIGLEFLSLCFNKPRGGFVSEKA